MKTTADSNRTLRSQLNLLIERSSAALVPYLDGEGIELSCCEPFLSIPICYKGKLRSRFLVCNKALHSIYHTSLVSNSTWLHAELCCKPFLCLKEDLRAY